MAERLGLFAAAAINTVTEPLTEDVFRRQMQAEWARSLASYGQPAIRIVSPRVYRMGPPWLWRDVEACENGMGA